MKKAILILIFLVISSLSGLIENALSWNEERTHRFLSEYAADNSALSVDKGNYLRYLGFNRGLDELLKLNGTEHDIRKWLQEGAELEDASSFGFPIWPSSTTRSFNHFHNPLKDWTQAGLNDLWAGESSLLWAQDRTKQQSIVEGDQTWQQARYYFYSALISETDLLRQENFAKMFRGLGHQMHLLQDTVVPDHVRNDAHPEDAIFGRNRLNGSAYFETWAKERFRNVNELKAFAPELSLPDVSFNVSYNGLAPITQLFDTDQYNGTNPSISLTQGLAEYTNANFFSNDTIFAAERYSTNNGHYFPYPKKSSTDLQNYLAGTKPEETVVAEDGTTDTGIWISKNADGENIEHFVRTSSLSKKWIYNIFGEGELLYKTFYRDDKCHADYSEKLIPRAVGYSAGLLDYFFRGNIEITLPGSGIYAQTDNPATGFSQIALLAQNTSPNNEQMNDGTIELVVGYRLAIDDPFVNYPVDYPFRAENEMTYIIVPEKNGIRSIPNNGSVELTFDLSQKPIPLWAINVFIRLIYNGQLGNEDGAVAVGFKDISEPTPIDLSNDMDKVCLNGKLCTAGSSEAIDLGDTNHDGILDWDIYPHALSDIYFKFSSPDYPGYASPSDYDISIPYLNAGNTIRVNYILTDYNNFLYNSMQGWESTSPEDPWYHVSWTSNLYSGIAIKNQVEYEEDPAVCAPMSAPCNIWWYPTFLDYRGRQTWWGVGIMYINWAYPQGSECSCYQGIIRTCPSSATALKATNVVSKDKLSQKRMEVQMQPIVDRQRRMPVDR
jgi:hypothetical protein